MSSGLNLRERVERGGQVMTAGDLGAEPGSERWAIAVRAEMAHCIHDVEFNAESLDRWLKGMENFRGWRQLYDENGQPFRTFPAFCVAPPPYGLGKESKDLRGRIRVALRDVRGRPEKDNNIMFSPDRQGTSREYTAARLERDGVALNGLSPHAAAVRRGWRKPIVSVRTDDMASAARTLRNKLSLEQRRQLAEALLSD